MVTCRCDCQLERGQHGAVRHAELSHRVVGEKPSQPVSLVTTLPKSRTPTKLLYIAVSITSGVALTLLFISLVLCCRARRERRRRRAACMYRARPLPAVPPTECGHYNTVSLRLTDEVGGCTQTFPIYHKLALSQTL